MQESRFTEAERKQFRLEHQRKVWGLVLPVDCKRCGVKATRRCRDLRPDHQGRLLNYPHDSRVKAAWDQLAENVRTTTNPEFKHLR